MMMMMMMIIIITIMIIIINNIFIANEQCVFALFQASPILFNFV